MEIDGTGLVGAEHDVTAITRPDRIGMKCRRLRDRGQATMYEIGQPQTGPWCGDLGHDRLLTIAGETDAEIWRGRDVDGADFTAGLIQPRQPRT